MILQAYDEFDLAARYYRRARMLDPESFRWIYYLALVQSASGQNDLAITNLRKALQLIASYLPARLKLAELLMAEGNLAGSRKIYHALIQEQPGSAWSRYGLGRVESVRGDPAAAVDHYERACELHAQFGAAHYALGLAYRQLGKMKKARDHLRLYERNQGNKPLLRDPFLKEIESLKAGALHHFNEGLRFETEGHVEEAVAEYEQALQLDSSLLQAHVNLISLYSVLGQFHKAEKHYRDCVRMNPDLSESHYNFGVMLALQGKSSEAAQAFRKALLINPAYADAHNNLGRILEREDRVDEASSHYLKALHHQPNHRRVHFNLGRVLQKRGRHQEAIDHFLKTITVGDQNTPFLIYTLADAYARTGNVRKAIDYARQAKKEALSLGQTELVKQIEKGLRRLEQTPGS